MVADFNHDGKLDLVVTTCDVANQVSIMLGNGDGTFQPPVNYDVKACPDIPVAGDFNHDGNLDLAVAVFKYGKVSEIAVLLRGARIVKVPTLPQKAREGRGNHILGDQQRLGRPPS